MRIGNLKLQNAEVKYSFLEYAEGKWMHLTYSIVPEAPEPIADQIRTIEQAELEFFERFSINEDTTILRRFFSSDLISHRDEIDKFKERKSSDFFLSVTEQPTTNSTKLAMIGMCLNNIKPGSKTRDGDLFYFDTTQDVQHLFFGNIVDSEADEYTNSEVQTEKIFSYLTEKLKKFNTTIKESVLRTWLYSPHIDADYNGIVKARKTLFDDINMTEDTHYIASTGIQGGSGNRFARVSMDVYAVIGIDTNTIRYIQAPEYLSPTHLYGVTFERATAAELGKSDFLFISGTASIDSEGEVVHVGDVVKQTERTLENISRLLDSGGFTKDDLASFIVYLRDPADFSFVEETITNYLENLPMVYVKAPVCRPEWLIEIEASAARLIK